MSEVNAAFASLAARTRKMNEQVANDTAKAGKQRVKIAENSAREQVKQAQFAKNAETKIALDGAKTQNKIALDSAKTHNKIMLNGARESHKIQADQVRASAKLKMEELRDHAKTERNKTKETQTEINRRQRIEERAAAKASANAGRRAHGIVQPFGRAARSTVGTVGGVMGGLGAASASMVIGASLMDSMALQGQANLLVNATRDKSGNATQTAGGLTGEAQSLAGKYGVGAGDVMKGMGVVSARAGGAKGLASYRADLEDITQTAVAFGVSMEDMGGVVAAALNSGVKPGQEMRDLIQDIAAMGKDGAVEIKDLAAELAKLGGAGKMTNLAAGTMLRRQVGMAQVAADAAVSPEESRTSIVDLMRDINTNAGSLKAAGINVYDKQGMMNDPAKILADTMDVAMTKGIGVRGKGNVKGSEALGKIFTGTSHKMVESLMADYNKGGAKGVMARIDASSGAKLAPGERDAGVAQMRKDPATQLRRAMETLKADIGTVLLPELVKLAPVLSSVTRSFAQLVAWAAQNPFTALTAVFGGYLAKELAAVGMSKMFEAGIKEMLGGLGGGVGGKGGKGGFFGSGAVGSMAAFGTIAMTATVVTLTAMKLISEADEADKRKGRTRYQAGAEAENALQKRGTAAEKLNALTAAESALASLPAKEINRETSLPQYLYKKYRMQAEAQGAAGGRETSDIQADIGRAKEDIYKEHEMASLMSAFAILGPAVKNAATELNTLKGGSLPGQTGAPTSRTPTDAKMK